VLLDTGIDQMIFALAPGERPPAVLDPSNPALLKPGTAVDLSAPTARPLALSYGFTYQPQEASPTIEPKLIRWAARARYRAAGLLQHRPHPARPLRLSLRRPLRRDRLFRSPDHAVNHRRFTAFLPSAPSHIGASRPGSRFLRQAVTERQDDVLFMLDCAGRKITPRRAD
jgi:hypothetical protein